MPGFGFLDLMEARFVDAFRAASVPWRVIRLCAEQAREITGSDHPFSSRRFRTDGRAMFAEVVSQAGEKQLLDLAKNQLAFARVVGPSLYAGIEFLSTRCPLVGARWERMKRSTSIQRGHSGSRSSAMAAFQPPLSRTPRTPKVLSRRSRCYFSCHSIPYARPFASRSGLLTDLPLEGLLRSQFIAASRPRIECSARRGGRSGEGGWVVISADWRIHRNRTEREAWRRSGLVVFSVTPVAERRDRMAPLRWWPRIDDQVRTVAPPAAFELPLANGAGRLRVLRG